MQPCVLTSVAEVEGTFDCFTTLLPQSIIEVFKKKVTKTEKVPRESRQLRHRTKDLYCALWKRKESPLAHNSVQAFKHEVPPFLRVLTRSRSLLISSHALVQKKWILNKLFVTELSLYQDLFHSSLTRQLVVTQTMSIVNNVSRAPVDRLTVKFAGEWSFWSIQALWGPLLDWEWEDEHVQRRYSVWWSFEDQMQCGRSEEIRRCKGE